MPSLVRVPIRTSVAVTYARRTAVEFVLVASTRSMRLPASYSARWIATLSAAWVAGFTVRTAERVVPPPVALIVALLAVVTVLVVTVNVVLVAPAGTVTLAGTVATAVLLLVRETGVPAEGAAAERVTVAVDVLPPVTVPGLRLSAETEAAGPPAGCTVRVVETVTPAPTAEMVTAVEAAGAEVVMLKEPATPKLPIWA